MDFALRCRQETVHTESTMDLVDILQFVALALIVAGMRLVFTPER